MDCMMWFFLKRDDPKRPFVIIRSKDKVLAQKRLVELLSGVEYRGTWEQTLVPREERTELLRKFRVNKLYEADVPKEKDLTKDYGINMGTVNA